MDAGRWRSIATLFSELTDLDPKAREARLAAAAAEDPGLADEVASLLQAHEAPFPPAPAPRDVPPPGAEDGPDPLTGARIGPYRVVERVGAGGMGVVYRAVRDDDQYRQEVALKLVRRGMDTEHVLERFRTERQILADLDHPHIARLLDGGAAPDGGPYLVMDLVSGEPVDAWCARGPSLRRRLELFLTVCDAVQHAHARLVVHRDLKPANILVGPDGRARLLDFGIAKLLDPAGGDRAADVTAPGARLLTLRYAAPEVLRGGRADTRADVWSLGVILFEMLAGRHPYTAGDDEAGTLARRLAREDLPRPSTVAGRDGGRLRGDLDVITATALQADPERRYPSVEALAEDLRRHLDGQPVAARPASPGYRAAKFVRRNAAAVAAATALFAVTLVFALVMAGQAARIGRQAREVAQQRDRAERVTALLVDMFDVSDPLLARGARGDTLRVRDFLLGSREAMIERLDGEPVLQADIVHMYGRLFGNLGEADEALTLTRRALDQRLAVLGPDHPDVARSLDYLGTLHQNRGEYARAESLFTAALDLRRAALGDENAETAESVNNLGVLHATRGDYAAARPYLEEALAARRRLLGPRHVEVAQSLNNLAVARWVGGDADAADSLFGEALAIRRETLGPRHPYVANTLNNLARLRRDHGRLGEAEAMFTEAVAIWEETLGPDHASVSAGWYNLGLVAEKRGDLARAVGCLERSLAIDRGALPTGHPYVGDGAYELGRVLLAAGRADRAAPLLHEAYAIRAEAGGDTAEVRIQLDRLARVGVPAEAGP